MIDIMSHNERGEAHGYWEVYMGNGELSYKCHYLNDDEVGYEEDHYTNKIKKRYYLR